MPLNRLVNEAVGEYLDTRSATVEAELEETLRRVKAYRHADADFESIVRAHLENEKAPAG